MGVALGIAVGIGRGRRATKPRDGAYCGLIKLPPTSLGPHEGLVVEAGRNQWRQEIADSTEIVAQGWPSILAFGHQPVMELDLSGARIGCMVRRIGSLAHQRIRLVRTRCHDATRTVIPERTTDQMDSIGEQRRGQCVAGQALKALAVEDEADRP